jgi:signal transduction histidine kinase
MVELIVSGKVAPESKDFKEYLNMAHQSSASMLELVNDILDLSKLQAGKFEVNKEKSSIKDLIENRMMFYKISADTRGVALETVSDPDLPNEINFDPQALRQILNNLLSNALKFTSVGGKVTVTSILVKPGASFENKIDFSKYPVLPNIDDLGIKQDSLCVMVSDTGIGIPAENLNELFQSIYSNDRCRNNYIPKLP